MKFLKKLIIKVLLILNQEMPSVNKRHIFSRKIVVTNEEVDKIITKLTRFYNIEVVETPKCRHSWLNYCQVFQLSIK